MKDIITGGIIGIIITLTLTSFLFYSGNAKLQIETKTNSESVVGTDEYSNTTNCYNMSLAETTQCILDYTKKFYKYNYTEDNITLTLEQLKN